MKSIYSVLLAAVAGMCASSAVSAADLGNRVSPSVSSSLSTPAEKPSARAFSWTGAYVGAYAGGEWGSDRTDYVKLYPKGGSLGLLGGYNYQWDNYVIGGEAEFGWDRTVGGNSFVAGGTTIRANDYTDWAGRLRVRAGWAGFDHFLPYLATGVTFENDKLRANDGTGIYSSNKTRVGWNLGAGVEYAFTQNVTVRGEYIHDDFGHMTYTLGGNDVKSSLLKDTVRAAVGYKF